MLQIDMSEENLYKLVNEEPINQGTYGKLYRISEDQLFKYQYKRFILTFENKTDYENFQMCLDIQRNTAGHFMNGYNSPFNVMKRIDDKRSKVKLTKLPLGIVTCNEAVVGYILHYHKDMENLYDYLCKHSISNEEKEKIIEQMKVRIKELLDNYIYPSDMTTRNILIDPKTMKIELIDLDDVTTNVREERVEYLEDDVLNVMEKNIKFLNSKVKKTGR